MVNLFINAYINVIADSIVCYLLKAYVHLVLSAGGWEEGQHLYFHNYDIRKSLLCA